MTLEERMRRLQVRHSLRGVVSIELAAKWDFGTVVGNGVQGALAFCRARVEEFVLSHEVLLVISTLSARNGETISVDGAAAELSQLSANYEVLALLFGAKFGFTRR